GDTWGSPWTGRPYGSLSCWGGMCFAHRSPCWVSGNDLGVGIQLGGACGRGRGLTASGLRGWDGPGAGFGDPARGNGPTDAGPVGPRLTSSRASAVRNAGWGDTSSRRRARRSFGRDMSRLRHVPRTDYGLHVFLPD